MSDLDRWRQIAEAHSNETRMLGISENLLTIEQATRAIAEAVAEARADRGFFKQCAKHQGTPFTMSVSYHPPPKEVCPNCERESQQPAPDEGAR